MVGWLMVYLFNGINKETDTATYIYIIIIIIMSRRLRGYP